MSPVSPHVAVVALSCFGRHSSGSALMFLVTRSSRSMTDCSWRAKALSFDFGLLTATKAARAGYHQCRPSHVLFGQGALHGLFLLVDYFHCRK